MPVRVAASPGTEAARSREESAKGRPLTTTLAVLVFYVRSVPVFLISFSLQTLETPTSAANRRVLMSGFFRRVLKFVLQIAVFFRSYHGTDRKFQASSPITHYKNRV